MSLVAALNSVQGPDPITGFLLCDLLEVQGGVSYYGYQALSGGWVIKSFNDTTGALRFCAGSSGYATAWADRTTLTFNLPAEA